MGSWSVYCGISKIAITAGQSCVFLPIKKIPHMILILSIYQFLVSMMIADINRTKIINE